MKKKTKTLNPLKMFDTTAEALQKLAENKVVIEPIKMKAVNPKYKENGDLDYVTFSTKGKKGDHMKVLRLIRVNSLPSVCASEEAFQKLLYEFGEENVSFVKIDAFKPGETLVFTYGVLAQGMEANKKDLILKSEEYIESVHAQLRAAFPNIELTSLTRKEDWIFLENFDFPNPTIVRGYPQPDGAKAQSAGTLPYRNPEDTKIDANQIFYNGMLAKESDGKLKGTAFLKIVIFDKLPRHEINRIFDKTRKLMQALANSRQFNLFQSTSMGVPIILGLGLNEMTGFSHGSSTALSDSTTISDGTNSSHSTANSTTHSDTTNHSETDAKAHQKGGSKTHTDSWNRGVDVKVPIPFVDAGGGNSGWGDSDAKGDSHSDTKTHSQMTGGGASDGKGNTIADASGKSHTAGSAHGKTQAQMDSKSNAIGHSGSGGGGVNFGDSEGGGRTIYNMFIETAFRNMEKNYNRIEAGLNEGMVETFTVVLTPDKKSKIKAESLIKQSWIDREATLPIRPLKMDEKVEKKILGYIKTLSKPRVEEKRPCILERDKFCSYLTTSEASTYSPLQSNLPGFVTTHDSVPGSLAIPGKMGDVETDAFLGYQLNSAMNVMSNDAYTLALDKLSHILIGGATGQGKTVFAKRFISEIHNKFDLNVLVFDVASDYRVLLNYAKDPSKVVFRSFDPNNFGIRFNPIVPPRGVNKEVWAEDIAQNFCFCFGLGGRSHLIVTELILELLDEAEIKHTTPTFKTLADKVLEEFIDRMNGKEIMIGNKKAIAKAGFKEQETFSSMRDRFRQWSRESSPVYQALCADGGFIDIEEIVRGDFLQIIECSYLPKNIQAFVINSMASAVFHYAKTTRRLKKPIYMIYEEAHSVLKTPTGNEPLDVPETVFERINREARKYNLYTGYICQEPEAIPPMIFNNTPLKVMFQLPDEESKKKIIGAGGRDSERFDKNLYNWLSRQPKGNCLIRYSNFDHMREGEFVGVKVERLPIDMDIIPDEQFRILYRKKTKKA